MNSKQNNILTGILGGLVLTGVVIAAASGSRFSSKHFTIEDVTRTSHATPTSDPEQYAPPKEAIKNANYLAKVFLDPLADRIEISVGSWFRNPRINAIVGGVIDSEHLRARAVDINTPGRSTAQLIDFIVGSGIPFTQLIDEGDHVHAVLIEGMENLKQVL